MTTASVWGANLETSQAVSPSFTQLTCQLYSHYQHKRNPPKPQIQCQEQWGNGAPNGATEMHGSQLSSRDSKGLPKKRETGRSILKVRLWSPHVLQPHSPHVGVGHACTSNNSESSFQRANPCAEHQEHRIGHTVFLKLIWLGSSYFLKI